MVNNYIFMIQAFQRFVVNKLMLKVFVSVSTCWLTLLWLQYIVQQLPAVLLSKDLMQTLSVKVTQVFAVCLVIFYTCVFLFNFLASKVSQSNSVLWKNLLDVRVKILLNSWSGFNWLHFNLKTMDQGTSNCDGVQPLITPTTNNSWKKICHILKQ